MSCNTNKLKKVGILMTTVYKSFQTKLSLLIKKVKGQKDKIKEITAQIEKQEQQWLIKEFKKWTKYSK